MNVDVAQELLNQLGSSLENLETQHAALLQFLKDEGVISDEKLAVYVSKAEIASDVRWRAARVRLERIISSEKQKEEQLAEKAQQKATPAPAPAQNTNEEAKGKSDESTGETASPAGSSAAKPAKQSAATQSNPEAAPQTTPKTENWQDGRTTDDAKDTRSTQEKRVEKHTDR